MSKILIVEDDLNLIELYAIVFKKHGYEVAMAYDGVSGLELAGSVKPSVILLDMMMPLLNGLEVLEQLKLHDHTKDIPVIILTNIIDSIVEEQARKIGVSKYLLKSQYLPEELVEIVKNVIPDSF